MKTQFFFKVLALCCLFALPREGHAVSEESVVQLVTSAGASRCSEPGYLITPVAAVVSAACVDGTSADSLYIRAGAGTPRVVVVGVASYVLHEAYSARQPGSPNVAIVSLRTPLVLSAEIQALNPESSEQLGSQLAGTSFAGYPGWIFTNAVEDSEVALPPVCP